jgi:hypothetical protein
VASIATTSAWTTVSPSPIPTRCRVGIAPPRPTIQGAATAQNIQQPSCHRTRRVNEWPCDSIVRYVCDAVSTARHADALAAIAVMRQSEGEGVRCAVAGSLG